MQQTMAFRSGALAGRNAAPRASGVRPARAAASRLVVQARQKEAGAGNLHKRCRCIYGIIKLWREAPRPAEGPPVLFAPAAVALNSAQSALSCSCKLTEAQCLMSLKQDAWQ